VSRLESLRFQMTWRFWLLVGAFLPLLVFLALAILVEGHPQGLAWDVLILTRIHAGTSPRLDRVAAILTGFGGFTGTLVLGTSLGLVLIYRQQWRSLAYLLMTLLGTGILNLSAKALFHRPRPQVWDGILPQWGYAFPSGHAMASLSLMIVLVALSWQSQWRWLALATGCIFAAAIAWTRLYLGAHYPTDILAGWLLALGWGVSASLVQPLIKPLNLPQDVP
jgi:membrane-associated phospholipid phosphatase